MSERPDESSVAGGPGISPEMARAEELVDEWSQAAGDLVSRWSRELLKQAALAREELEDIWAEAQSLNRDREA